MKEGIFVKVKWEDVEKVVSYYHAADQLLFAIGLDIDDFENPMDTLNELIDWHISITTNPKTNGGFELRKKSEALDSILYEIHRRAEKEWADDGNDFTVTISNEDYKNLVEDGY